MYDSCIFDYAEIPESVIIESEDLLEVNVEKNDSLN